MRPISKRERVLLALFVGAGLIVASIVGIRWFAERVASHRQELAMAETELEEIQHWIAEEDLWSAKEQWLRENPPPAHDPEQSESAFVEQMQRSLAGAGIEIQEQRLLETPAAGVFHEVGVELVVNSTLEQLVRWLHGVQQPGDFREIRRMQLKSDADNSKIRCELTIVRFFSKSRNGTEGPNP